MSSMKGWASVPTGTGAIGVPRTRCVRPIAGAAIAGMLVAIGLPLTAMSASAAVRPGFGITVFPATDIVIASGYVPTSSHTITVLRGGFTVGTSKAVANALGDIEVNHLGGVVNCWQGITPDLRAGDVIQVDGANGDTTAIAGVTVTDAARGAGTTVTIKGTAADANGVRIPIGQLEARVIADADFAKNATPKLRAPGDGTLAYDGAGNAWTATFELSLADRILAIGAESRGMWIGPVGEITIVEKGALAAPPIVGGPAGAPCTAPAAVGPTKPTITAATDLGASATDGLTSNTSPTFSGVTDLATSTRVDLFVDGAATANGTAIVGADGLYSITPTTPLTAGTHVITATEFSATDTATPGNVPASVTIDTTPATVTGIFPATNAAGTRMTGNVTATLNEAVDPKTVTPATFTLKSAAGTAIPAVTTFNPATKVVTLDPRASLALGTRYTAALTAGITDAAGNPLAPRTWSFTTAPSQVASYINRVYSDLFNRAPDPTGMAGWTARLNSGTPRVAVANAITSSGEYRSKLIAGSYAKYLLRAPDAGGLSANLAAMNRGMTISQMESGFIASPEYYAKAGGTDATWVVKLYADVLGRAAAPAEVASWTANLRAGRSRSQVAMGFLLSTERLTTVVNGYYQQLLGRGLDPSGRASTVRMLQAGGRNEAIIGGIISSTEYFAKS